MPMASNRTASKKTIAKTSHLRQDVKVKIRVMEIMGVRVIMGGGMERVSNILVAFINCMSQ